MEGHEGAARFYTELLTAFPDIRFDLESIVIGPQGVCEEARVTATHKGRWLSQGRAHRGAPGVAQRNLLPWDPAARKFSRRDRVHRPDTLTATPAPGRSAA